MAVLAFVAVFACCTFRDFGLGWDDFTHSQYGDLLLKLYGSGFTDTRAFNFVNLYRYGGGFDMAAALADKVLPFGLFETRRLIGAAVGLFGLFVTWRIGRRLGGPLAGLAALILLASCPLYIGHMFINAKDAPFAAAMALLLLGIVRACDEYPNPDARTVALVGAGIGLVFGSRILGLIAGPYALASLLLIAGAQARRLGVKPAALRLVQFIGTMLPALVLGYLIMGLLWPWSVQSPLNPLYAAEYFDKFFEKPWREIYEGRLISVPDMPPSYLPHLFVLKLPEIMLVLGLGGAAGALIGATRKATSANKRAGLLAVALAALFPVALAIVARPALYNGLRHFIFVVPPFAALGGVAFAWLFAHIRHYGKAAAAAWIAFCLAGIASPIVDMIQLHPFEYTSFNRSSGGVRSAQGRYMIDYWGLAFKQAADELRTNLAKSADRPPRGRRWVVAICGPQSSARVELGDDFETVFDQKQADFVMALGTYYCQPLQATILANIEREGVTYARVYDLRGGPTPKILTQPPP